MKICISILVLLLVSFVSVENILAEERCTLRKGSYLATTKEALNELHQISSDNDQEGIKQLVTERKIIPLPEEMAVKVKEKQPEGFVHFLIPAFQFEGWALQEDIHCIELIEIPDFDYFPLEIGNMWEYIIVGYNNNEKYERTFQRKITGKKINEDGSVTFLSEGKPYLYKYREGVVDAKGQMLMKLPLVHGEGWQSHGDRAFAKILRVQDAGFRFDLNGTSYLNCIRIISRSDYHALSRENGVEYTAFEDQSVYAPDVGLLQTDVYEIRKDDGRRTHILNKQLVSFKTNQPVPDDDNKSSGEGSRVELVNSFRFPETHFIHPSISPDEKWLIYFKSDTVWEELYYTEADKNEKNLLPVFPQRPAGKEDRNTIGGRVWSPDGNILAVEIELGYDEHISLIDFSSGTPQLIETLTGEQPAFVESTGDLLYLDEFGNINKKKAGNPPEHVVFVRSSYALRNNVTHFQTAKDGTILYTTGHPSTPSVHLAAMQNPHETILLLDGSSKAVNGTDQVRLSASYDLSPNGKYALFYIPKSGNNFSGSSLLLDLKSREIISQHPFSFRERAVWSPDGEMLAYLASNQPEADKDNPESTVRTNPHFFIYNVVTGETTDFGIGVFSEFNWAPDGMYIVYSGKYAHETIPSVEDGIFLVDLKGTEIGKISSVGSSGRPVISSSGKYMLWGSWDYDTFFIAKNPYRQRLFQNDGKKRSESSLPASSCLLAMTATTKGQSLRAP